MTDYAAATATTEAPPGPKASFITVTVCSTARGLRIEGKIAYHDPSGRRHPGKGVLDSYRMTRVLAPTELLAFVAWWTTSRVDMLPDRPDLAVGLPVPLASIAAERPGSLPGEGKGRGAVRSRKSNRKADPIKEDQLYDQSAAGRSEARTAP